MKEQPRWTVIGVVTFIVAGVLLLSMGGGIVAGPVTVPLMQVAAARHPTRGFRVTAMVLSALTTAEVAWALTYFAVNEAHPWIWLLPSVAALAVVAISRRVSSPPRRASVAPGMTTTS